MEEYPLSKRRHSHASEAAENKIQNDFNWWQLSLIGVSSTIGTGYFLGSSIGIKAAGPSIVFSFILAAFGTFTVYHLLAKMTVAEPMQGSFCSYAGKAFGNWAGFCCGWIYWSSSLLIMGSQLTALSILSRFWFERIPLWLFASGYAILAIIVQLFGLKGFDKVENLLAIVKTAAAIMFILLAFAALFQWIPGATSHFQFPGSVKKLFPLGFTGFWSSLIYAFYAFAGVEVIGLMAMHLKKKEDAPKSGNIMLIVLTIIYVLSLGLAVSMESYQAFNENESPFVKAMEDTHLAFFPDIFNGAIIIAGFSTMTAALFSVTTLLVTLAEDGNAPSFFKKKIKKFKNLPLPSLGMGAVGLLISIIAAFLLPDRIYEYITTSAGILLLFNWLFILISAVRLLQLHLSTLLIAALGALIIAAAIAGTMMEKAVRPGFYMSMASVVGIALLALLLKKLNILKE
ncbi:amino acid permease [Sporolactobacillus sp. THM7-4]|nr:amino acid permease [Sporolactobacillus sp. THM7-4]